MENVVKTAVFVILVVNVSDTIVPYMLPFFSVQFRRKFCRMQYWYHIHVLVSLNSTKTSGKIGVRPRQSVERFCFCTCLNVTIYFWCSLRL